MSRVAHWFVRSLSSPRLDLALAQLACWAVAVLVMGLGFAKLGRLPLSETELFFGVLLILSVALQCVVIGMVLPLLNGKIRAE